MSAVTEGLMIGIPIALVTFVVGSYTRCFAGSYTGSCFLYHNEYLLFFLLPTAVRKCKKLL